MDEQDDYIPQPGSRPGWRVGGSIDPIPRQDVTLPPRMPEAAEIARLTAQLAERDAAIAAAYEAAAVAAEDRGEQYQEPTQHNYDMRDGCYDAAQSIRSLTPSDALAALERVKAEARGDVAGLVDAAKQMLIEYDEVDLDHAEPTSMTSAVNELRAALAAWEGRE